MSSYSVSHPEDESRELLRKRLKARLAKAAIPLPADAWADHLRPAAVPSELALKTVKAAVTLVGAKMPAAVAGFISSSVRDLMQETLRSLASSRRRWWLAVIFLGLTLSRLEGLPSGFAAVGDRCEGCQRVEVILPRERHPRVHLYSNDPSHLFLPEARIYAFFDMLASRQISSVFASVGRIPQRNGRVESLNSLGTRSLTPPAYKRGFIPWRASGRLLPATPRI